MITITENAKSQVISLLKEEEKDLDHFVRVAVKAGGCSGLSYDLTFDNNNIIFQVSVPDSVMSIYYASIKDAQPTDGVTDTIPANFLVIGKLLRTSPYDTKFIFIDECDLYTMDYNTESIDKLVDLSDCIIDANFLSNGKSVVVESDKKRIYIYAE